MSNNIQTNNNEYQSIVRENIVSSLDMALTLYEIIDESYRYSTNYTILYEYEDDNDPIKQAIINIHESIENGDGDNDRSLLKRLIEIVNEKESEREGSHSDSECVEPFHDNNNDLTSSSIEGNHHLTSVEKWGLNPDVVYVNMKKIFDSYRRVEIISDYICETEINPNSTKYQFCQKFINTLRLERNISFLNIANWFMPIDEVLNEQYEYLWHEFVPPSYWSDY